jgi:DNA-binding transcriptional LysR family regulator
VDLGELQVFLMVAKEGSFSRAGERLYRTQPAISLAIRKLGTHWGSLCSCAARALCGSPMPERS